VQDQLAGRHRREGLGEHQPVGPAPDPQLHRVADVHPDPLQVPAAQVEGEVAEVVDRDHAGPHPTPVDPRAGPLQPDQPPRIHLRPQLARVDPRGQMGRRRGEHVPPVEGPRHRLQPVRRVLEGVHPLDPTQRLGRPHQQPVVRPDQHLPAGLDRHHPPPGPHPRVDHRQVHGPRQVRHGLGQHPGPVPHVLGPHGMAHVDHPHPGRHPGHHPVAHPHEGVLQPVVGGEGDPLVPGHARHCGTPPTQVARDGGRHQRAVGPASVKPRVW
jgi:hypothetical protein